MFASVASHWEYLTFFDFEPSTERLVTDQALENLGQFALKVNIPLDCMSSPPLWAPLESTRRACFIFISPAFAIEMQRPCIFIMEEGLLVR